MATVTSDKPSKVCEPEISSGRFCGWFRIKIVPHATPIPSSIEGEPVLDNHVQWVVKDNEEVVPGLNSVELELSKEAHAYANYATSYETICNQSSTIAHPNEGSQPPSRHIAVSLVKAEAKKRWKRLFIRKLDLQLDKALQGCLMTVVFGGLTGSICALPSMIFSQFFSDPSCLNKLI
ncbi:hypothetical protein ACOSP7_022182 [Xanthoceras sorbifolium]